MSKVKEKRDKKDKKKINLPTLLLDLKEKKIKTTRGL